MGTVGVDMYLFFVVDINTDNNAGEFILISCNGMIIVK